MADRNDLPSEKGWIRRVGPEFITLCFVFRKTGLQTTFVRNVNLTYKRNHSFLNYSSGFQHSTLFSVRRVTSLITDLFSKYTEFLIGCLRKKQECAVTAPHVTVAG